MITVTVYGSLSECISHPSCTGCIGEMYHAMCWYPGKRIHMENQT